MLIHSLVKVPTVHTYCRGVHRLDRLYRFARDENIAATGRRLVFSLRPCHFNTVVIIVVDSHIQRIVLATEETTV